MVAVVLVGAVDREEAGRREKTMGNSGQQIPLSGFVRRNEQ